jgi:hypothetical protein
MAKSGRLSNIAELRRSAEVTTTGPITIGIDLGDRYSHCCFLGRFLRIAVVERPPDFLDDSDQRLVRHKCARPQPFVELVAHDPRRLGDEQREQIGRFRRQMNLVTAAEQLAPL